MKCLTRSQAPAPKPTAETDMSPELKEPKQSAPSFCVPSAITCPFQNPKGHDNDKENCENKTSSGDALLCEDVAEDSGYLSLQNSQLEHWDGDSHCIDTPETLSPIQSQSKSSFLPVLKFQEEVCRQLAEGYKRHQRYDWTVVDKLSERYGLQNIIGPKMGLEYVDVLNGLLKKDMKHILTMILGLLGDYDLINCTKVSRTWRKIIHQDHGAVQRYRRVDEMLRLQNSGRCAGSLSRDFGVSRVAFSCLQAVASSTPSHKSIKKSHNQTGVGVSRFTQFYEASKSLKGHEALRSCRLCGSPARYDSAMKRAVCLRASCAFDFCSLCHSAYHGSTKCLRGILRTSSPNRQSEPLAGSALSKRNIRRL